jgi:YHS domain-containing protein
MENQVPQADMVIAKTLEVTQVCGNCGNEAAQGIREITYADSDRTWHFCSEDCKASFIASNPPLWNTD